MTGQSSPQHQACPIVTGFFERRTSSIQYVVAGRNTARSSIRSWTSTRNPERPARIRQMR